MRLFFSLDFLSEMLGLKFIKHNNDNFKWPYSFTRFSFLKWFERL